MDEHLLALPSDGPGGKYRLPGSTRPETLGYSIEEQVKRPDVG